MNMIPATYEGVMSEAASRYYKAQTPDEYMAVRPIFEMAAALSDTEEHKAQAKDGARRALMAAEHRRAVLALA